VKRTRTERPTEERPSNSAERPTAHLEEVERPQAMASPSYGIDVVSLALAAVVLAAAVLFLLIQIVPELTDLMMPPPLVGN
jgi:hypothetical protein